MAINWSSLKIPLLSFVDLVNSATEPWNKFDRLIDLAPGSEGSLEEILAKLYIAKSTDISKWTLLEGKLFLQSMPNDLGDACIWQGVYTAWAVLSNSRRADNAVAGLADMCDARGRLVRGRAPIKATLVDSNNKAEYVQGAEVYLRYGASLDSLAGFLFGVSVVYKFGTKAQKACIKPAIERFAKAFRASNHCLLGADNQVTKYGDCSVKFLQAPVRNLAGCLGDRFLSFEGTDTSWKGLAKKYENEFSRLETHFLWKHGWYNDNLAALLAAAYYFATTEGDPGHKQVREGLKVLLDKQAESGNAFLTYLSIACGVSVSTLQKDKANKALAEFRLEGLPDGKKPLAVVSSTNPSIKKVKWGKETYAAQPLPVWKRPPSDFVWQRNPYLLDGGPDPQEHPCLDYLLAYVLRVRTQ